MIASLLACIATSGTAQGGNAQPAAQQPQVKIVRLPERCLQPQAVVDAAGRIRLIYFRGDPTAGDLYYEVWSPEGRRLSEPVRVNSVRGTATAIGAIRGAQIALGSRGSVHVAWNGLGEMQQNGYRRNYLAYASLRGAAFSPQRELTPTGTVLSGGCSVAADAAGYVYVVWHTGPAEESESNGGVYLRISCDDGRSFGPAREISASGVGECGCCGMKALADRAGDLWILYRAASEGVHRDTMLLKSDDHGATFRSIRLDPWRLQECPMSSFALADGPSGVAGAWETAGAVREASLESSRLAAGPFIGRAGAGAEKYPALAVDNNGNTLLAWVAGAGWQRGGELQWQVYSRTGAPLSLPGKAAAVPAWSFSASVAQPGGGFLLIY